MTHIPDPAPYYDFDHLLLHYAPLRPVLTPPYDLSDRQTTLLLAQAILKVHFNLTLTLPAPHLVPTIPNRVQYLRWAVSLLPPGNYHLLDIGTGPSAIYCLLGSRLWPEWTFTGTEVETESIDLARKNVVENGLNNVNIFQTDGTFFPKNVVQSCPDVTVCNPPFHSVYYENSAGTEGQMATEGGELHFLKRMADETVTGLDVSWYTSLIGRKGDVGKLVRYLREEVWAVRVHSAELCAGGRTTRWAVAWTFGNHFSTVRVEKERWRVILTICPGRRYANRLEAADVQSVVNVVMQDLGWDGEGVHEKEGSKVETMVARGGTGEWKAYLKVAHRGNLSETDVTQLGDQAATRIQQELDGTQS